MVVAPKDHLSKSLVLLSQEFRAPKHMDSPGKQWWTTYWKHFRNPAEFETHWVLGLFDFKYTFVFLKKWWSWSKEPSLFNKRQRVNSKPWTETCLKLIDSILMTCLTVERMHKTFIPNDVALCYVKGLPVLFHCKSTSPSSAFNSTHLKLLVSGNWNSAE